MKKELTPDSTPQEKAEALKASADYFGSDLTEIITSDKDGNLESITVFARGEYAKPLARFLTKLSKDVDRDRRKAKKAANP